MARSAIAVKALMTGTYPDPEDPKAFVAEFWTLDVYKGGDKMASALGVNGAGQEGMFHLRDQ